MPAHKRWRVGTFLWVILLVVSCCASFRCAQAQESATNGLTACNGGSGPATQSLRGVVSDPTGAAIPNASIFVACGNFRRASQSDQTGNYSIPVPVGSYFVRAVAAGFANWSEKVVVPEGQDGLQENIALKVISTTSTVNVVANPDYVADNTDTGTKTTTALIEVPQSISVVTSMQMQARDVQTVDQAIAYTAGVDPEPYGNDPRVDWFFIRGFSQSDDSVYLDGLGTTKVYAFESQFSVSPYSLQSVDVMKGPTSVLYGSNQPGGLVNLVSKRPPSEETNELRFEFGSYDRYQGSLDFGGPLSQSGKWLYRLTGQVRSSGSQVHFATDDLAYAEPSITWRRNDATSITFLGNYTGVRQKSVEQFIPAQGTLLPNPNGRISPSFYDADPNFDNYQKKLDFGGWAAQRRLTSTWVFRQNFRYSHLGVNYKTLYGIGIQPDLRTMSRASLVGTVNASHIALDNQLQGAVHTGRLHHTLLAGFGFQNQNDLTKYGFLGYDFLNEVPPLDVYNPVYGLNITPPPYNSINATETIKQYGAYLQDEIHLDKWIFSLAGREDWVPQTLHDALASNVIIKNDSKFTDRAGVLYHSSIGLAPYFSYSTSFTPTAGVDANGNKFKPTTAEQYETGLKFQPAHLNAFLTASVFSVTQDHTLTADPSNPLNQIQTGQTRSRGVELESVASLGFNLNFVGSFTHDQVRYTHNNDGTVGKVPLFTPANLTSLWLDYTPKHWGVGAGARFVGLTWADPMNTLPVPGHTLMDAEVHFEAHGLRYAFSAANLLDKTYVSYCFQTIACNYGPLRTVTGTITYRFHSLLNPLKQE